jgi:hypothetical protein
MPLFASRAGVIRCTAALRENRTVTAKEAQLTRAGPRLRVHTVAIDRGMTLSFCGVYGYGK